MSNLFVWVDEARQGQLKSRIAELSRRHAEFKEYIGDDDPIQKTLDLVFPNGMPLNFHAANLSIVDRPDDNLNLALRPQLNPVQPWPFPKGCSLAVRGYWPRRVASPIFMIQEFIEVADAPVHSYERDLSVIVYHANPQLLPASQRINNVLTAELAHDLPPISVKTREKLVDWSDFLKWKRKLVSEKTRGLRYIHRGWQEEKLVFTVVGDDDTTVKEIFRTISRLDVVAFEVGVSTDHWTFRIDDRDSGRRAPRGAELGQPEALSKSEQLDEWLKRVDFDHEQLALLKKRLEKCEWESPTVAFVTVPLSEDEINLMSVAEDLGTTQKLLIERIPEQGFLSVSAAGDLALIRRHEQAINKLRDQGGFAPYLSTYLFDITEANRPETIETVQEWFRDELNPFQKQAVEKILAAPDICLVQGPPGTGKTTVIAEAIMQLARRGERVLLASQAHTAVDNALERLGKHADLRVIRLARDQDKVSGDGKGFVEGAALFRYYTGLAEQTESRFLNPWQERQTRLSALLAWQDRAEFMRRDLEGASQEYSKFERNALRLRQARDCAWKQLQETAQRYQEAQQTRDRFIALEEFLRSGAGEVPAGLSLPEPVTSSLAESIFSFSAIQVRLPVTLSDWRAVPQQRSQMLTGLLMFSRSLREKVNLIEADVNRLIEAGPQALKDPNVAVKLAACEADLKELEAKVDADGDDDIVQAWRNKRQDIKQLRSSSAGGLNPEIYESLFVDSSYWCAPIDNAKRIGEELQYRLNEIKMRRHAFALAWKQLVDSVSVQIANSSLNPPDEAEWRASETELQRHQVTAQLMEQRLGEQRLRAATLINDTSLFPEAVDVSADSNASLARRIRDVAIEIESLQQASTSQEAAKGVWEPLMQEWVNELKNPASAQADWEHYKEVFVPQCNVVAITCNEREQTLEDSGQVSFDVAIIDEVSKATPLEMLLPLMRARRAVLVGDHRQLPPLFQEGTDAQTFSDVVEEAEEDEEENRTSLTKQNLQRFEKMVTASLFKSHFEAADDSIRERLEIQFRMHPQIMSMINHFYENRLSCGLKDPDAQRAHHLVIKDKEGVPVVSENDHVLWIDTSRNLDDQIHKEDSDANGRPMRSNRLEAELIAHTLLQLESQCAASGYSPQRRRRVGVVSFYARQLKLIREAIRKVKPPNGRFDCLDVEINTVIRYQGKEKPIVLVSLVRNDGFDPSKSAGVVRKRSSKANVARYEFINVAFSRAQELLIVFGARAMYESYNVTLPHMDNEGHSTRMVYKDILAQLDREARLIPASQFMKRTVEDGKLSTSKSKEDRLGALV